ALAAFFGTDQIRFTATWAGVERSFNKFTDAAKEAGKSRIYAGIHWSFDVAAGEQVGRKVGQFVVGHYFQPLPDSGGRHKAVPPPARHAGGRLAPAAPAGGLAGPGVFIGPAVAPAAICKAPVDEGGCRTPGSRGRRRAPGHPGGTGLRGLEL